MSTAAEMITTWIATNPHKAANQRAFADAVGISEGRLSQILGGELASPKLTLRIHGFTGGEVPAWIIRPDLWSGPENVPVQEAAQ